MSSPALGFEESIRHKKRRAGLCLIHVSLRILKRGMSLRAGLCNNTEVQAGLIHKVTGGSMELAEGEGQKRGQLGLAWQTLPLNIDSVVRDITC